MVLTKWVVILFLLVGCGVPQKIEESTIPEEIKDEVNHSDECEDEMISDEELPSVQYLVFEDITKEIGHVLNDDIGFVYHNLVTDQWISFNEKKHFYAASTVKTLIAMQLLDVGFDLSAEVVLKSSHLQKGRGAITNRGTVGQSYVLEEVLYEMMVSSDNTATQMAFELGRPYQAWTYAGNYSSSGGHHRLYNGENLVTPEYMADAMLYLHHNQSHYQYVMDLKFKTPDQMNLFDDMDVYAKKPGQSISRSSFSQIGILYEDQPFVFVIYAQNSRSIEDMRTVAQVMLTAHRENR